MNNREYKFRAWDKVIKTMNYNPSVGCAGSEDYEINDAFIENNSQKLVWMQFTGLKDKNGKKIYEGDILKWTHPSFQEMKKEYKILEMSDIRKSLMLEPDCLNGWIEVIGNIYESPELLK